MRKHPYNHFPHCILFVSRAPVGNAVIYGEYHSHLFFCSPAAQPQYCKQCCRRDLFTKVSFSLKISCTLLPEHISTLQWELNSAFNIKKQKCFPKLTSVIMHTFLPWDIFWVRLPVLECKIFSIITSHLPKHRR